MDDTNDRSVSTAEGVEVLMVGDSVLLRNSDRRTLHELPAARSSALFSTLSTLRTPASVEQATSVIAEATGSTADDAERALAHLLRAGIAVPQEPDPTFALGSWEPHGWGDAFRYHRHLRLLPMIDWSLAESSAVDRALMEAYLAEGDPPPLSTEHPQRVKATEDWYRIDSSISERLREFSDTRSKPAAEGLRSDELALLLQGTFGRTGTRNLPITGAHITKTSPSGGSRHPIEAYVLISEGIDGVSPGTLHVNVGAATLDRLDDRDPGVVVRDDLVILRDRPSFRPAATCVLVATCERSMFRYRESRSYRVLLHDAGHLLQTFAYIAGSLRRPSYRGYTLREEAIMDYLGLEQLHCIPLAFVAVG